MLMFSASTESPRDEKRDGIVIDGTDVGAAVLASNLHTHKRYEPHDMHPHPHTYRQGQQLGHPDWDDAEDADDDPDCSPRRWG